MEKTNFRFAFAMAAPLIACLFGVSCSVASAQGYPVVVPASSSGAASRAIVQINQADIYNNISNANNTANYAVSVGAGAQNTANYAVSVGSGAQNTANWAVNIGSAAQGAADRAYAEAAAGGVVTKYGETYSGGGRDYMNYICIRGRQEDKQVNGWPQSDWLCPAGSGPVTLSAGTDQP